MCVVSMVHRHFQEPFWPQPTGPGRLDPNWMPSIPEVPSLPPQWNWTRWDEYQELLRKAKAYDEMMKQPNCPNPNKEAMMVEIEKRLTEKFGLRPQA